MEYIFAFVRAGDLKSAREFCFKVGQSWRAATLEGAQLYNDENYLNLDLNSNGKSQMQEIFKNEGNLNRDLWRLMVQHLIKNEHFGIYEKAVYASLGGFVNPVIPVCRNYLDFVWVYFKALYNHLIEKEIRQKITHREFVNIPYDTDEDHIFGNLNKISNSSQMLSQIFERIKVLISNSGSSLGGINGADLFGGNSNQIVANLKLDAQKPSSVILKHIILSGVNGFQSVSNELMDYLKTVLQSDEKLNGPLLRFSAHLTIFYRSASINLKNETFIQINDNYVEYLIENKYKEIIAYYLSQLPSDIQTKRYSKFLQNITDNKERLLLLKLAKERNMNVQAITLNIVDTLSRQEQQQQHQLSFAAAKRPLDQTSSNEFLSATMIVSKMTNLLTSSSQILNDQDKTKINALDWIAYDPTQRLKLLEYANLTLRYFLLERQNLEATKTIFSKIPQDTLTCILNQYNCTTLQNQTNPLVENSLQQVIDNLPNNVANSIKEFLSVKEYLEAISLYSEWFDFYHREKPVKPESKETSGAVVGSEQTFAERMAYDYQIKQFEDLSARWYSKALLFSEKVKAKFFSVLKFPFGGWMCEIESYSNDEMTDEDLESDENNEISDDNDDDDEKMLDTTKKTKNQEMSKTNELNSIRKLYLPNICFILLDMLNKMNLNKELIKLSDLIASEQYKLYLLFERQQLKCFLNKIADASIGLLDSNSDYLGY
jgi:nuclear pore complex protein Nup107